jgi:hypothetical protein
MRRIQALLAKEDNDEDSQDSDSDDDDNDDENYTKKSFSGLIRSKRALVDVDEKDKQSEDDGKDVNDEKERKEGKEGQKDNENTGDIIELLEHPKIEIDEYEPVAEEEDEEKESSGTKLPEVVDIDVPKESAPFKLAPKSKVLETKVYRRQPKK